MKNLEQLLKQAENIGVKLNPNEAEKLSVFVRMILDKGIKMGLSGRESEEEIYEKDILDSLLLAPFVPLKGRVLDVGTGVGVPGIPLKILFPEVPFYLIDAKRKATLFLEEVVEKLSLTNIRIKHTRVEDLPCEPHDLILGRAVSPAPHFLEAASFLMAQDGQIILQKGRKWAAEEQETLPVLARSKLKISRVINGLIGEQKLVFVERVR